MFCPVQGQLEFDRVRAAISDRILEFSRVRIATGQVRFHAQDLRDYVAAIHPTAPASSDRILRALRQSGALAYMVIDRSKSLYEVLDPAARRVA